MHDHRIHNGAPKYTERGLARKSTRPKRIRYALSADERIRMEIVHRLPFKPVFVETDNGREFQRRFLEHCDALKLEHHVIHKSSPNENAGIERSFRTDEEEYIFFQKTPLEHYDDLRIRYEAYLHRYNYERPYLGIDLKTPMEVIFTNVAYVGGGVRTDCFWTLV